MALNPLPTQTGNLIPVNSKTSPTTSGAAKSSGGFFSDITGLLTKAGETAIDVLSAKELAEINSQNSGQQFRPTQTPVQSSPVQGGFTTNQFAGILLALGLATFAIISFD